MQEHLTVQDLNNPDGIVSICPFVCEVRKRLEEGDNLTWENILTTYCYKVNRSQGCVAARGNRCNVPQTYGDSKNRLVSHSLVK